MWALTICQVLHFPIGVACRRLIGGQADALYLGGALISALVWAVLGSEVGVGAAGILSHGYMAHVLPLPLATLAMLVGPWSWCSVRPRDASGWLMCKTGHARHWSLTSSRRRS